MVAYTTTYNLAKPTVGDDEDAWGGYLNGNFDTLESLLKGTTALTAIDVTGNITVGGNVDGRDIAADGSKLDGIETGATADQTKADIDALNINAATLDSLDSTQFLRSDAADSASNTITISTGTNPALVAASDDWGEQLEIKRTNSSVNWPSIKFSNDAGEHGRVFVDVSNDNLMYVKNGGSNYETVWTSLTDGSGSGLDADTVDGIQASSFLRSDTSDTTSGDTITFSSTSTSPKLFMSGNGGASSYNYIIRGSNDVGFGAVHFINGSTKTSDGGANTYTIRNDIGTLRLGTSGYSTVLEGSVVITTAKLDVDQELRVINGDGSNTHFNYADGSNNYIRGGITTIDTGVDLNQNDIYDVRYLTATYLRAGDGNDGYFYSDINGRTAFTGGEFYITSGVPYYYNFATNQYHGGSSGDNHYFRGNTLSGDSWSLTGAGAASFASVNINGNLNAVDNIYLADRIYHEGDTDTSISFGTDTVYVVAGGQTEITVTPTGVQLGDGGNGYFQPVSGQYGSIQIGGGAHNYWEGYSIGGRAVFMHDNASGMGLYNDVNNHWAVYSAFNGATELYYAGLTKLQTTSTGANIQGDLNAVDNVYVANAIYHEGDTNTYVSFGTDAIYLTAGGNNNFTIGNGYTNINQPMYNYSVYYEDYDALSGTSVTVNCDTAQAFSLTMTGNTTFTFNSVSSPWSTGFVLELTGNGGTVTWPTSVDWAGGTAPDAPASGETDIYVFWTRDGGTTWYGVLSVDAAA